MLRLSGIPKWLISATIALGAFTFTMDTTPGTPQIQSIIPTTFFKTTSWAAPWLGLIGSAFIFVAGMVYLEVQRRRAQRKGEGYGTNLRNEPVTADDVKLPYPLIAILPLVTVGVVSLVLTRLIPQWYPATYTFSLPGMSAPISIEIAKINAILAVVGALCSGIFVMLLSGFASIRGTFAEGSKAAVGGAILATMNTESEYGFGAVIAALPGFLVVARALQSISNPLINEAVTINLLSGITGSSSGGTATLPHNCAVIALLAVTGPTHRAAYRDMFFMTGIKVAASFLVITIFLETTLV